jgi:hypothetical protein
VIDRESPRPRDRLDYPSRVRGGPLLLVDLGSLLHRSLHSERGTARATAWRVVDHVLSAAVRHDAEGVVVCDEEPREQLRRRRLDAGYKGRRADRTEREAEHFALARLAVDALGLPRVRVPEEEADDVCASYARAHSWRDRHPDPGPRPARMRVERVGVDFLGGSGVLHADACAVLLGVVPHRLACYKALVGDPSDNYRGVPGVGPRTAVELLRRWGSFRSSSSGAPRSTGGQADCCGTAGRRACAATSWRGYGMTWTSCGADLGGRRGPGAARAHAARPGVPDPERRADRRPTHGAAAGAGPRHAATVTNGAAPSLGARAPAAARRATRTRVRPQDDPRALTLF